MVGRVELEAELQALLREKRVCRDCRNGVVALYEKTYLVEEDSCEGVETALFDLMQNYFCFQESGCLLDGITFLSGQDQFMVPVDATGLVEPLLTTAHALREEHTE